MVFSDLFRGGDAAAQYASHLQNQIIALSFQTVGELWYGAIKAGWGEAKRRELDERIRRFVVLACDKATVRAWAELRAVAESKGLSKQTTDLWIAATAKRHSLPMLSRDKGFFTALDIEIIAPADPPRSSASS